MAGHSHWKQIQHRKGAEDARRGMLFSKLLSTIAVAARGNPDPQGNPRLRTAIEKARAAQVPREQIERAVRRAAEEKNLEELVVEAYGPEGCGLIIECVTNSRNRTIAEVKHVLNSRGAKFAESGSVRWGFEPPAPGGEWKPKFTQPIGEKARGELSALVAALKEREDVQRVTANAR